MDINSLLSPDPESRESTPRSPSNPYAQATSLGNNHPVRPPNQPRKSSGLSQQLLPDYSSPSPTPTSSSTSPHFNARPYLPHKDQRSSLPSIAAYNAAAASSRPVLDHRMSSSDASSAMPTSTPGMDALAEVASRQSPRMPSRHAERSSTSASSHTAPHRSPVDSIIPDSPKRLAPPSVHTYGASSLTVDESHSLADLSKQLHGDRFNWNAQVGFVGLLHKGFSRHVESGKDAHSYELLRDLRHAREFMDETLPVGEDIWVDWLTDENLLVRTFEDRFKLMELHSRSVREEPNSAQLWRLYGDYMYFLWTCANRPNNGDNHDWSPDDKLVGQQVFTWDKMMEVWEGGVENTKLHINDSNLVWDRYIEIILMDLARQAPPQKVEQVKRLFLDRLLHPHTTWAQTSQAFSSFISTYDNKNYEEVMVDMSQRSSKVKKSFEMREPFEFKIQQALERMDKTAEYAAYTEYLDWELRMKGVFSYELISSLYARVTTRFHTDASFWNDYVEFLIEASKPGTGATIVVVLERATRRCPCSGELWAHRLLALETEQRGFQEIEAIKHVATASLQIDKTGLDDLLKVYIAWCGYLRRRAFNAGAAEDELDVAEVGIRSALENYREAGEKLLGKEFVGDPLYRLERIHIRLLTQRNDLSGSRAIWNKLIKQQQDSYDFWYRYYIWEMVIWGSESNKFRRVGAPGQISSPKEATAILRQALKRLDTVDSPEELIVMYLNHCEQHESVDAYRMAMIEARQTKKRVAERRERERAEQWAAYYAQQQQATTDEQTTGIKRAAEDTIEEQSAKKHKQDVQEAPDMPPSETQPVVKRDREHNLIVVKNLPADATELKVRQFFRDCGTINSIKFQSEGDSKTAMVEFETTDDARYAQTKVTKPFDGNQLEIELASGTTLWVTNYPPAADEKYIRQLFKDFGEVADVRFPSLQGNTNRRFCYVQFLDPNEARNATALDGKVLDGQFHLSVKISNPSKKEDRHGALYEEREVYVRNVHWRATEDEVKTAFEQCGAVEKTRIPRNLAGKSKGVAFVVFEQKEGAAKAVEVLNNTPFKTRTINVELSVPKAKRLVTTVIRQNTHSPSPEPMADGVTNGDAMVLDNQEDVNDSSTDAKTARSRTIAIINLPDTVNSAQLEALVSPVGDIKKLSLRPDHGGAIIEFAEEKSVGAAGLQLEGQEFHGKVIRIGTVPQLLKQKPELKATKIGDKKKVESKTRAPAAFTPGSGVVSRPGQVHGRRGGLGKRSGLGFSAARADKKEGEDEESKDGSSKSNADFRALFIKSSEGSSNAANGTDQLKED